MTPLRDVPTDPWACRALEAHFARHPVDATFVGLHEHDHRLPDISPEGLEETVETMRGLLAEEGGEERAGDDRSPVLGFARLDRLLVRGFLVSRTWEYLSGHVSANPAAHVGDAVFGLMGPLLSGHAPLGERLAAVESRMAALPQYLEGARALLMADDRPVEGRPVPTAWARRAIRECRAGVRFLDDGVVRLRETAEGDDAARLDRPTFRRARAGAVDAFEAFARALETDVLPGGRPDVACGPEAFDTYLRHGHVLRRSADEILAYARDEMDRTRAWLESATADFGASSPEEVVAGLAELHPSADGYLERYRETWDEMREVAEGLDLVTWPDFPLEYVERPGWARSSAPDLYFLFYRSPAAFARPPVHRYMVAPLDPSLPGEDTERFLRANNDSVIKLNHVVHHGGIGHHVQNWHAFRSPSLVGRIAAVDCATRIAMFCGGTMAEGWACYATDLMAEAGALTDRERYAEHHGRVRMCARAIVDIELHHGRMSLAEAADFYRESAGMSASAAETEAVKNGMFPGTALMYLVGTDMIHDLRSDLIGIQRDDFVLRDFHDAFLSYGSIPVRLIADEMRRRAEAGLALDAHSPVEGSTARER